MDNIFDKKICRKVRVTLSLEVKQLFLHDYKVMEGIDTTIQVCNISKEGVGFTCKSKLPIGYYFNSKIQLGKEDFFYSVIHIIKSSFINESEYLLGAEFVGLAPFLANKIEEYEKRVDNCI